MLTWNASFIDHTSCGPRCRRRRRRCRRDAPVGLENQTSEREAVEEEGGEGRREGGRQGCTLHRHCRRRFATAPLPPSEQARRLSNCVFCRCVCARKESERGGTSALLFACFTPMAIWFGSVFYRFKREHSRWTQVLNIPSAEFTCPKNKARINITSTMYSLPPARSLTFAPSPPPCVRKLCAFHSCLPPPSLSPYSRCRVPRAARRRAVAAAALLLLSLAHLAASFFRREREREGRDMCRRPSRKCTAAVVGGVQCLNTGYQTTITCFIKLGMSIPTSMVSKGHV